MDLSLHLLLVLLQVSQAADLQCFMGRNPRNYRPRVYNVCQRYRFQQTPQCLKFTQGDVVTRDCDPSFLCERFNIRNRCARNLGQAVLFGEVCCCSTDLCNVGAALPPPSLLLALLPLSRLVSVP